MWSLNIVEIKQRHCIAPTCMMMRLGIVTAWSSQVVYHCCLLFCFHHCSLTCLVYWTEYRFIKFTSYSFLKKKPRCVISYFVCFPDKSIFSYCKRQGLFPFPFVWYLILAYEANFVPYSDSSFLWLVSNMNILCFFIFEND